MVTNYQTPGVYHERADTSAPAISATRMDIAGFVGIAPRGPVDTPVPVQSWRQFQSYFGGFTGYAYLAFSVRAFFENGGRRCWVVRVASQDPAGGATESSFNLQSPSGDKVWGIFANGPGTWGNNVSFMVKEINRFQTITVVPVSNHNYSAVTTTDGFKRGMMVRLSQGSTDIDVKVISGVDYINKRIIWIHPKHENRLPYDSPLSGFDSDLPVFVDSVEYTLIVKESGRLIAQYDGLSLVPNTENYGPDLLSPLKIPLTMDGGERIPSLPQPIIIRELRRLEDNPLDVFKNIKVPSDSFKQLSGGTDGLSLLTAYDFIGEEISPLDSDQQKRRKRRGMRALDLVNEVAIVAVPDINIQPLPIPERVAPEPVVVDPCLPDETIPVALPVGSRGVTEVPPVFSEDDIYRVQAALIQHSEDRRDRVAILDPPFNVSQNDELGIGAVRAWRMRFDSKYAAFYYPWVRVVNPLRFNSDSITRDVPPSGHVAGQYAAADFEVGVHKAPANASLVWVQDVTNNINETVHGVLNPIGLNVIRSFPSRGIRVFGARTVSSDPDWRYVNVRRLMIMIEKAIDLSVQWAVFEPNDVITRTKLKLSLTSFLTQLWQQGALVGNTEEEAFFAKCDEENNPAFERENGRLIADVGVAPSKPFEFIILRVGRSGNEFEISESRL